jgi:hypothetical protein
LGGEVYHVRSGNGIERAAKDFFSQAQSAGTARSSFYARKLNRLRSCPIIQPVRHAGLVSLLRQEFPFLVQRVRRRRDPDRFSRAPARQSACRHVEALHLLHALTKGVEEFIGWRVPRRSFTRETSS